MLNRKQCPISSLSVFNIDSILQLRTSQWLHDFLQSLNESKSELAQFTVNFILIFLIKLFVQKKCVEWARPVEVVSKWSVVSRREGKMCEKAPKNLRFFGRKGDDSLFSSLAYKFECILVYVIGWQQVALKLVTSIVALR